jgi:serine/threonine protein kinase
MQSEIETLLHTEEQISAYFDLESKISSTHNADLFKARDRSRGAHMLLWIGRQPLPLNSPAVRSFLKRMSAIKRLDPPVTSLESFGVDSAGLPFCIFPTFDGYAITTGNAEGSEAERRFISCLKLVDRLHAQGLVCGDLCGNSFWVDRRGEVRFIGVLGAVETDALGQKNLPLEEVVQYISPEQNNNGKIDARSDVFALGVLAYKLFSQNYPFDLDRLRQSSEDSKTSEIYAYNPLNQVMNNPPAWGDQIVSTCLLLDPKDRYSSAGSILSAVYQIRENISASEKTPAKTGRETRPINRSDSKLLKVSKPINTSQVVEEESDKKTNSQSRLFIKAGIVVLTVFVLSFLMFKELFIATNKNESNLESALEFHGQAIKDTGITMPVGDSKGSGSEKAEYYSKMVMSDDPIYHAVLIKAAQDAQLDEDRMQAETAILDRARRLGLRRSVEVVKPWLRTIKTGALPAGYEPTLRALDKTLPAEARDSALRQAYAGNPRVIMRLTAALALDTDDYEKYQKVLAQLVGDASNGEDLSSRSLLSLLLYHTDLASIFGDDAVQRKEKIPDSDVVWLLSILAQRNDIQVRAIASLAVDRKLLSPIREYFISSIRDREDLPLDILNALVKASTGTLKKEDMSSFGNWYDRHCEGILLAIAADAPDQETRLEAFEIVSAKSFILEPATTLINWIRNNAWDKRTEFAQSIGVLSHMEFYDFEQILKSVSVFEPYLKDQTVMAALLDNKQPQIVKALLQKYMKHVGLGRRLALLEYPDKEVKMMAIASLKSMNDVFGLKIILDHYAKEKDPEIKKLYQETFEVIAEKEGMKNN